MSLVVSLRKRRQKRHASYTSYFPASLQSISLSSSRGQIILPREYFEAFGLAERGSFTLKGPRNLNIGTNIFVSWFASCVGFSDSSLMHTQAWPGPASRAVNFSFVLMWMCILISLLILFFPSSYSLLLFHSVFDLCRQEIQDSNRYWSAIDCHCKLHVSNNHCVDSSHSQEFGFLSGLQKRGLGKVGLSGIGNWFDSLFLSKDQQCS